MVCDLVTTHSLTHRTRPPESIRTDPTRSAQRLQAVCVRALLSLGLLLRLLDSPEWS